MRRIFLSLCLLITTLWLSAQTKELTIEDAVIGQYRKFLPENLSQPSWRNATNFIYTEDWEKIVEANIKNDKTNVICEMKDINTELAKLSIPQLSYLYGLNWIDENSFYLQNENYIFTYNIVEKKISNVVTLPENAAQVFYNTDAKAVAYTVENNLHYIKIDSKSIAITSETNSGIVCGSDYVHRQEFGIDRGIFWSPNGNFIAYYRKDETMVAEYPITDYTTPMAENKPIRYPMAGEKSEEVTLGVYDIANKKTTFLKTGEPREQYLTCITWSPDEKYIFIAVLNREQNHLKLNKYDAKTGELLKTLFEEKNDRYVEPEKRLHFLKNTPNQFLWYSERDGYKHLYLYDTEGVLIKQVTKGEWIVKDIITFDIDEKNLFIYATKDSPIEQHAHKINMKNLEMTKLTSDKGMHEVYISTDAKYFLDTYSSTEVPYSATLFSMDNKLIRNILTAENPYKNYTLGNLTIGTIKAADDKTDLYYRLITPPNYDKTKKYPVIVYVYGGPHAQLIENSWLGGASLWDFYMAQKGYILFTVDNRGSDNRGFEFESIIHRNCGQNEMKDQIKGIEFLKTLGYADMDRIGVYGWSYGGFMSTSLMTNYPEIFKVGVAGGPVIDWKYYEVMYGERYMDTPQENQEGYKKASLLNQAKNLKGRHLIIHGVIDPVVVWQNSIMFVEKCIEEKVLLDYFIYPTSEHNVQGYDRIHLKRKITQHFDDNL